MIQRDEDICLWPCGTWAYREDIEAMLGFMSDDYEVIEYDTEQWHQLSEN